MPVNRALLKLLQVRELEEEQCRSALASAAAALRRLEQALAAARERGRTGRALMLAGAQGGNLEDRLAATEEVRASLRHAAFLWPRIQSAELQVAASRQKLLAKRTECRQAKTLIETERRRDAIEQNRKQQQALDEWHRSRRDREDARKEH